MKRRRGEPGEPGEPREPDDRAAGAGGADADAQDDTNAQLRAMRAVWLSMREEDPPDGGLVDLLAAARAKVATLRARPTLRQRVLAVLRRPPALAFATLVVLVGSAVLVIGRGNGVRSSDPAASSSSSGTEDRAVVRDAERATALKIGSTSAGPQSAATIERLPAAEADVRSPVSEPANKRAAPPITAPTHKQASLEQLHEQCEAAARRGDCAAVRQMLSRIAKTDRGYRARVVKGSAVAKCLATEP